VAGGGEGGHASFVTQEMTLTITFPVNLGTHSDSFTMCLEGLWNQPIPTDELVYVIYTPTPGGIDSIFAIPLIGAQLGS
jgi:hypothetical protein